MKNKRKSLLIDKEFQINIIIHSLFLTTLCLLVFFALDFFIFNKLNSLVATYINDSELQKQMLAEKLSQIRLKSFIILSLSTLTITSVSLLYISHRVAGPIYRTKLWLKTVDKSEALKFRKGDFFSDLATELNLFNRK